MLKKLFLSAVSVVTILWLTSCSSQSMIIPKATNAINVVGLSELRLNHSTDYTIMNSISAEAKVIYSSHNGGKQVSIEEENGEFKLEYKYDSKKKSYVFAGCEGIARFGFLESGYARVSDQSDPANMARNIAIYRLINAAKVSGADGIIEPIVTTNVDGQSKRRNKEIIFRTTVSGKPIKLNVDAK